MKKHAHKSFFPAASNRPLSGNAAFTLVELLVIIAVIGLLVSLLIPALGRAKDHSKLIVCRSNQKNLLLGCRTYANDNNSALPVDKQLHNSHIQLMYQLSAGDYINEPKVYYCPSVKNGRLSEELKYSEENLRKGNISYFYFSFTDKATYIYLSRFLLTDTPWPSLLTDTARGDKWVFSDSWFSNLPTAHRWYKKGVNYVTIDGSVHMVKAGPRDEFK